MLKWIVVVSATLAFAGIGMAQDKSTGCGPGWFVTKNMSFSATTTRGTTNSPVAIFGMTSGTSGCAKHSIAWNEQRGFEFLAANYDQISHDVARGDGEYLTALGKSFGCRERDIPAFRDALRTNYDGIFMNRAAEETFSSIRSVVKQDVRLMGCRYDGTTG